MGSAFDGAVGQVTNTGGTATVAATLGNMANSPIADRLPKKFSATTTLNVNNTTGSLTIATLTGNVSVVQIIGTVTTVLSSNITAAHLRMNDATNTPAITLAAGTTLSAAPVGTVLSKTGLAAAAIVQNTSAQVRVIEHATSGLLPNCGFDLCAKSGATNLLEFRYSTTNTPSTGAILWDIWYYPINGGSLA